jgi:hypothetical protein
VTSARLIASSRNGGNVKSACSELSILLLPICEPIPEPLEPIAQHLNDGSDPLHKQAHEHKYIGGNFFDHRDLREKPRRSGRGGIAGRLEGGGRT